MFKKKHHIHMCSFGSQKFTSGLKSILLFSQAFAMYITLPPLRGSGYTFFHNPKFAKRFISPENHISRPASRFSLMKRTLWLEAFEPLLCSTVTTSCTCAPLKFLSGFREAKVRLWSMSSQIDRFFANHFSLCCGIFLCCLFGLIWKNNMYHLFETLISYCILSDSTALTVKFQPLMWWCSTALQPSTFVMWLFFTAVRNLRGPKVPAEKPPEILQIFAHFCCSFFFCTHRDCWCFFLVKGKKLCLFFGRKVILHNRKKFKGQGISEEKPSSSEKNQVSRFFWYYAMTQSFHML